MTSNRTARAGLFVQQATSIEAVRRPVVQIEKPVRTAILAGKELPVLLRHQPFQFLVGEFIELLWRDRLARAETAFHHSTRVTPSGLKPRSATLPLRPRTPLALFSERIS